MRALVEQVQRGDTKDLKPAVEPAPIAIEDIPFGVELEMEAKPDTWHFTVNQLKFMVGESEFKPWGLHPKLKKWKIEKDDSLMKGRSAEAVSPVMNLREKGAAKGKAEEEIERIYALARELNGHTTNRCGLHIHVDARVLGEKGLANLFRMCMENESLIFKLSQNGLPQHRGVLKDFGWKHNLKYYYSRPFTPYLADPFPIMHAEDPAHLGHALYNQVPSSDEHPRPALPDLAGFATFKPDRRDPVRYFGVNFNSFWYQGTIEFRLFNATDDPQQVMTAVKMALGMVAAAAQGDYAYVQTQPLDADHPDRPIPKESYEYFMSHVARMPGVRQQLDATFQKGGGQIVPSVPFTDPHVLGAARLLAAGHRFVIDGKAISSPVEVVDELKRGTRPVTMIKPGDAAPAPVKDLKALTVPV